MRLPFLDGIRGIAILVVFLYHGIFATFGYDKLPWKGLFRSFDAPASFLLLTPLGYGGFGVAIFFVVSGFCIHLSHQRSSSGNWLLFANKRFFRIYPPYLLATLCFFFLFPWGDVGRDGGSGAIQLFSHLAVVHNLDTRTFFGINGALWSVAAEIQLYALYPLLLLLVHRLGWRKALLVVASCELTLRLLIAWRAVVGAGDLPAAIGFSPFAFWFSWTLGAYLGECLIAKRTSRLFSPRFAWVALIALLCPWFKPLSPFGFLLFAWLTAIAIDRLLSGRWLIPATSAQQRLWSHLSSLGIISYSFYLFHLPILNQTRPLLALASGGVAVPPLLTYAACLAWYPLIYLLALALHRLIELPSIRLGVLLWKSWHPQAQASPAALPTRGPLARLRR